MAEERTFMQRVGAAASTAGSLGGEGTPWRRRAVIVLAVLAVVFLLYTAARNWSRLPDIEWRFRPGWLALCVAMLAVFQAIQAQVWTWMVHALGSPLPRAKAWSIWCVTLLARYVPSNVGMIVGRTAMAEREGVPKRVTMASVFYQLGVTLGGAAAVGAYFVIELPNLQDQPARFAALAIPLLALIGLDPLVFPRLADFALRRLGSEPLPLALSRVQVIALMGISAVSFAVAGVAVWALAEAIQSHGVAAHDVPVVIGAYSVGYAISVLTVFLPGGLGAREGAMVFALKTVMPLAVAIAVPIAIRLLQIGVEVVYATLTPVWARRSGTSVERG
jgi:hypothetical protein